MSRQNKKAYLLQIFYYHHDHSNRSAYKDKGKEVNFIWRKNTTMCIHFLNDAEMNKIPENFFKETRVHWNRIQYINIVPHVSNASECFPFKTLSLRPRVAYRDLLRNRGTFRCSAVTTHKFKDMEACTQLIDYKHFLLEGREKLLC